MYEAHKGVKYFKQTRYLAVHNEYVDTATGVPSLQDSTCVSLHATCGGVAQLNA